MPIYNYQKIIIYRYAKISFIIIEGKIFLVFFIKNTCIISCNVYNIVRLKLLYEKEMFLWSTKLFMTVMIAKG